MNPDTILSDLEPAEMLAKTGELYGSNAVFTTSLGAEDMVILDLIMKSRTNIEIATIDTGRLPKETYDLIENVRNEMGVDLRIYFPDREEVEEMVNSRGINLFYRSRENRHLCCNVRKVNPLKKILQNKSAWITGIRGDQTSVRKLSKKCEYDSDHKVWKVNPLLDWSREEVWSYIRQNRIPYNSLFDNNYKSIGCEPCTRAVGREEDERSGRWWWEEGIKECGLHISENANAGFHVAGRSGDSAD
jgi:phosphoadenosine phosphosulfate reductase